MLDMNRIRKEPREVERLLANKGCIVNFDETLALLERADVVLHGIGRADEMARKRQLPPAVEAEVLKRGAVSEAYGCYFDRNGKMVCSASTVAHDLGKLKPDCAWIAVAAGTGKAEAIDGDPLTDGGFPRRRVLPGTGRRHIARAGAV